MSTINISFDTKTKSLSCKIDGVELPDVQSVSFYKYENYDDEEKIDMNIGMKTEDEENGICYHNMMVAADLYQIPQGATEIPGSNGIYSHKWNNSSLQDDANRMVLGS